MKKEQFVYISIWCSTVIYSIYRFSTATHKYFQHYRDNFGDFTRGIAFLSSKRDKSDIEFEAILFITENLLPWLLVHLLVGRFIRVYVQSPRVLKVWQILFSVTYILLKLNFMCLLILSIQPLVFYVVKRIYPMKTTIIWLLTSSFLVILNYLKSTISDKEPLETFQLTDCELYSIIIGLFWMNLKCTSYNLETDKIDLLDFFSYCFYLPTFFTGPFLLYENFRRSFELSNPPPDFTKFSKNVAKGLLYLLALYTTLHFVYVNAVAYHLQFINDLDSWCLYGYGYTMGQYFHIKYLVQYGLSTSMASCDGVKVPNLPRCIGRVHLYSDMWRYFDMGLYEFLVKHIYVPSSGLFEGNKPLRSFLCFAFVYFWHGLEKHVLVWSLLNYSGIIVENLWMKKKEECGRKDCFFMAVLLAMSAVSNFYFFAGTDVGNVFVKRLFTDIQGSLWLLLALYCCCKTSIELRRV
ncbi:unnamed protein product, partial [Phyllotreta striolata]